jgi:hypothetical protein
VDQVVEETGARSRLQSGDCLDGIDGNGSGVANRCRIDLASDFGKP